MLASLNPRGILITTIFLLVMKEVHSDDFEAFKTMVLEKFQALKEENVLLSLKLDNCQASASESSIEIQGLREKIIKQEENLNNTKVWNMCFRVFHTTKMKISKGCVRSFKK